MANERSLQKWGIPLFLPNRTPSLKRNLGLLEFDSPKIFIGGGKVTMHAENHGELLMVDEYDSVIFISKKGVYIGLSEGMDPDEKPFLTHLVVEPPPLSTLFCTLIYPPGKLKLRSAFYLPDKEDRSWIMLDRWQMVSKNPEPDPIQHHLFVQNNPDILSQMFFRFSTRLPRKT